MHRVILDKQIDYDGSQARSGWINETTGLTGEAIIAFQGACDVQPEHMLDGEDLEAGATIRATKMLHFLAEHPGINLELATAYQRLLAAIVRDVLAEEFGVTGLSRSGDDLYREGRKLSISVAAPSPTSCLIHFALNIDPSGAPVPALGLDELGLDPQAVAQAILNAYVHEVEGCRRAASKVRRAL